MPVPDLLFITFQTFLPSEPSARVDELDAVGTPLGAARSFSEALNALRAWRQQIIIVVTDLQANPEPLKLFNSVRALISNLISADNSFATQVSNASKHQHQVYCTDQVLLQLMGLLEIELSTRAQEDDEERRRKAKQTSPHQLMPLHLL